MRFRRNTLLYWAIVWGLFPAFGLIEGAYCLARFLDFTSGARTAAQL